VATHALPQSGTSWSSESSSIEPNSNLNILHSLKAPQIKFQLHNHLLVEFQYLPKDPSFLLVRAQLPAHPPPLLSSVSSKGRAHRVRIYIASSDDFTNHHLNGSTGRTVGVTRVPWVAWERMEIVGVTRVSETISTLPICGDNQPNHPERGSPTRGMDLSFAPFGPYATISPLPRPSAYLSFCSIRIYNHQRINHFAPHFQVGAACGRSVRFTSYIQTCCHRIASVLGRVKHFGVGV